MTSTDRTRTSRTTARRAMGGALAAIGIGHFVAPQGFEAIVPDELPAKRALVYGSGVAEIGLGAALALRPSRRVAWAIVALLVAVFPANVNMAVRDIQIPGAPAVPRWAAWARLPLQAVMIWAVLAVTRPTADDAR